MDKPVVPKIGRKSGSGAQRPDEPSSSKSSASDAPTYGVVGASIAAAIGAGILAGLGPAVLAGVVALVVLGGLYSLAARRWGWPPLRWDAIPFIIP